MCLITKQKKAKIAKKDITVYKKVNLYSDKITSEVRKFEYEIEKEYTTVLTPKSIAGLSIGTDFTMYDEAVNKAYPISSLYEYVIPSNVNLNVISEGFHAFKRKDRCYYNAICTIPKGSEYFEDATGLIVSNQIIIKEIITN